jgi:hypothetical protein
MCGAQSRASHSIYQWFTRLPDCPGSIGTPILSEGVVSSAKMLMTGSSIEESGKSAPKFERETKELPEPRMVRGTGHEVGKMSKIAEVKL